MPWNFVSFALAAVFLEIGTQAAARVELFPSDIVKAGGGWKPTPLSEPPLWDTDTNRRFSQRIRLFIGGPALNSFSIRIDERNGRRAGFFTQHKGRKIVTQQRFTVRDADFSELETLIDRAGLWSIYPQFFVLQPDNICLDGITLIFERRDSTGYRYSEGNAQCTLGPAQLKVAAKLMRMGDQPDLTWLLPASSVE